MKDNKIPPPYERLSYDEKISNDYDWFKRCAKYFIGMSQELKLNNALLDLNFNECKDSRKEEFEYQLNMLYRLYHNDIDVDLLSEFVSRQTKTKSSTATKIRNLNIIKPNIDYINSNYRKRKFNWSVVNTDPNSYNEFQTKFIEELDKRIKSRFTQLINSEGEQKEIDITPDTIKKEFSGTYKDLVSNKYQKYITNVINQVNLHEKLGECFLDYLIWGLPVSFISINEQNKIEFRRVDARFFRSSRSQSKKYGKHSEWQVELQLLNLNDVLNLYNSALQKDKDYENILKTSTFSQETFVNDISYTRLKGVSNKEYNDKYPVYHIYFQSQKKIKEISYYENEVLVTKEVSEEYKIDKDVETVNEKWVNCIYEVHKIGAYYFNMGEYKFDCSDLSDNKECIMPYDSISFGHYYSDKVYSPLKLGIPYLVSFLICIYLIDELMIKHEGKIFIMDINAIPKKAGWDLDRFMKYSSKLGYAFIDRSGTEVDKSFNQYQTVDKNQLPQIIDLFNLAKSFEELWNNVISVPRQLRGQTFASDEVGTTRSAVTQSGITIDYIYQKFDDYTNSIMETILELGKYLIVNNDKENLVYTDDSIELLDLTPEMVIASKLKLAPFNNSEENDNLMEVKNIAKINNQQDPLVLTEIIGAKSMSELRSIIKKLNTDSDLRQQQAEEATHKRTLETEEFRKNLLEFENYLAKELDTHQTDNKIRLNQNSTISPTRDYDKDGIPDILEQQNKNAIENRKLDIENKKIESNERINKEKIENQKKTK